MRIAIFRNISHPIPPANGYGGTDRGVFQLCKELSRRGVECHVFCASSPFLETLPGTKAHSIFPPAGRPSDAHQRREYEDRTRLHFDFALQRFTELDAQQRFDVINVRVDSGYLLSRLVERFGRERLVYSLHNVPSKSVATFFRDPKIQCTAHTAAHKEDHGALPNIAVVPYGVELSAAGNLPVDATLPDTYLLALGAIGPHKGTLSAIHSAVACKVPLVLAGVPFDPRGAEVSGYFAKCLEMCGRFGFPFVGEVGEARKICLIMRAAAVIFCSGREDSSWSEPFGRVVAESIILGTPVLGYESKAIRELIIPGKTGELFMEIGHSPAAFARSQRLSRTEIASIGDAQFSVRLFAQKFLEVCAVIARCNSTTSEVYEIRDMP